MHTRFKQSLKKGFSIIEIVVSLSLMSFLFVLTLDILNISFDTTNLNKEKFLLNQISENEFEKLRNQVKTQEIRYGELRLSECFAQVDFLPDPQAECVPEILVNDSEIEGYNVISKLSKENNKLIGEINISKGSNNLVQKKELIREL